MDDMITRANRLAGGDDCLIRILRDEVLLLREQAKHDWRVIVETKDACRTVADERNRLAAERDAAVKDAERYQWIRDNAKDGAVKTLLPLYRAHYFVSLEPIDECPTFDAAIDAAILAAKGEK